MLEKEGTEKYQQPLFSYLPGTAALSALNSSSNNTGPRGLRELGQVISPQFLCV